MRYLVLAADYDGTLAHDGRIDEPTWAALRRVRESGRRVVLVTGRELDDLLLTCPEIDRFDAVVAENGAVLYWPEKREAVDLGTPPPWKFVEALARRGVQPLSAGHVIVATCKPHDRAVLDVIRELGLELQVIFNKGSVMVLPSGVNKATGLEACLDHLRLSRHNAVGVGDGENDHAFLAHCECGVAVANAVPAVREQADLVTKLPNGTGVVELVNRLVENDLADLAPALRRHELILGTGPDGTEQTLAAYGCNVLVAGTSGSGKSTFTTAFLERLTEARYQYVVIDPEGDHSSLEGVIGLGLPERAPLLEEVLDVIEATSQSAVVNLVGLPLNERPTFFDRLLPRLLDLRVRTGRPHWLIIDETHHLLPKAWSASDETMPRTPHNLWMITVHPGSVAPAVLATVDLLLALGESPDRTIAEFCQALGRPVPTLRPTVLDPGDALAWKFSEGGVPFVLKGRPPKTERRRHLRKYAAGRLEEGRSFRFRGPEGKLNLPAHNLMSFLELADGVDDATWMHHLTAKEYSRWFREGIKDEDLANEVEQIEGQKGIDPVESRAAIRRAIESRYTFPAEPA
jgi:hydroxymethylpyrimidine pyrophosphatase-like HAD family hydrolase